VRLALDLLPLVFFAFLLLSLLLQLAVEGLAFLPICPDAKSIRHLCSIAALCVCKRMGFRNSPWPVVLELELFILKLFPHFRHFCLDHVVVVALVL
jgi:hypothetical protein